jgi:hypothetical protein
MTKHSTTHTIDNNDGNERKLFQPALSTITSTTLPILTQIMTGISMTLIAITLDQNRGVENLQNTKLIAITLFCISSAFSWLSTEACIASQAYGYFSLSKELRSHMNISEDSSYIEKCLKESTHWLKLSVLFYRFGGVLIVLGIVSLIWPSYLSLVFLILYPTVLVFFRIYIYRRDHKFLNYPD